MYIFFKLKSFFVAGITKIFNTVKYVFPRYVNLIKAILLRKTNTFIKSKYSKNRQWSKSIVYFGLWFGVISAFSLFYYNYRFLFIISYLWWIPAITSAVSIIPILKLNYLYINFNFIKIFF